MFSRLVASLIVSALVIFGGFFVGLNLLVKAPLWLSHAKCPAFTIGRPHTMAGVELQAAQAIRNKIPASLVSRTFSQAVNVDASTGIIVVRTSAAKLNAEQFGAFRTALRAGTVILANRENAPNCYSWAIVTEAGVPLMIAQYDAPVFSPEIG